MILIQTVHLIEAYVIVQFGFAKILWSYSAFVQVRLWSGRNRKCTITARQYGEVVLPDDSTGKGPGTLASKLSRGKEGMARVFAVAVQIISKPEISHGVGAKQKP